MYKVRILTLARADLKEIRLYLSEFGDAPKRKFRNSFDKFAGNVSSNPLIYPVYEDNPDYRVAVIEYGYLVFYSVNESIVGVARVLSDRRNVQDII